MRIEQNPFYLLDVTPYDNVDVINEKAEDKAFMDDDNEQAYQDARLTLLSPAKRLSAEIRWFYTDDEFNFQQFCQREMCFFDDDDYTNFSVDLSYSDRNEREQVLIYIEALKRVPVLSVASCISDLDSAYGCIEDEADELLEVINQARRKAHINICKDLAQLKLELDGLLVDVVEALNSVFDRFSHDEVIEIANELAEIKEYEESYNQVYEKFMDLYAIKYSETLKSYQRYIFNMVEDISNFEAPDDLNELCSITRKFDNIAQPLQVYLLSRGQSNLQSESVAIAKRIRNLAVELYRETNSAEMSIKLINLEIELFSELPEFYEQLQEDKVLVEQLINSKSIEDEIESKMMELDVNIVREEGYEPQNRNYLQSRLSEFEDAILDYKDKLMEGSESEDEDYGHKCFLIAKRFHALSSALTWADMWKEALHYARYAMSWAKASGIKEVIVAMQKNYDNINENLQEINREEKHSRNITYEGEWGLVFKDRIKISPQGIEWKGKLYRLEDIEYTSWGIYKTYINGIPTNTERIVRFGYGPYGERIDLGKSVYPKFVECLFNAVSGRINKTILENFKYNRETGFGDKIKDDGIQYDEHNWFSKDVHKFYTWKELYISGYDGYLHVKDLDDKTLEAWSYIDHNNVHMLEVILRLAIKKKVNRLSDLLNL